MNQELVDRVAELRSRSMTVVYVSDVVRRQAEMISELTQEIARLERVAATLSGETERLRKELAAVTQPSAIPEPGRSA